MDAKLEEKKSRLLEALDKGVAQIHLDARRPGVLVPAKFRDDYHLVLNLSYRFDPPDLAVNDWGVRQTLSFGGSRFTVGVPWSAVYAAASLVTREFFMFPWDMPDEVMAGAVEKQDAVPPPEPEAAKTPRAILREVVLAAPPEEGTRDVPEVAEARPRPPVALKVASEVPEAPPAPSGEGPPEDPPSGPRRGHLRLVK